MLEFYAAFATFDGTIGFTKNIIQSASAAIGNNDEIEWDDDKIDLSNFSVKTLNNLVLEHNSELSIEDLTNLDKLTSYSKSLKVPLKESRFLKRHFE